MTRGRVIKGEPLEDCRQVVLEAVLNRLWEFDDGTAVYYLLTETFPALVHRVLLLRKLGQPGAYRQAALLEAEELTLLAQLADEMVAGHRLQIDVGGVLSDEVVAHNEARAARAERVLGLLGG